MNYLATDTVAWIALALALVNVGIEVAIWRQRR
jgi:hypothetical protein